MVKRMEVTAEGDDLYNVFGSSFSKGLRYGATLELVNVSATGDAYTTLTTYDSYLTVDVACNAHQLLRVMGKWPFMPSDATQLC